MDINQQLDQMSAMLRDFVPVLWSYYQDLLKQGFSKEQAFRLVQDYQFLTLNPGGKDRK